MLGKLKYIILMFILMLCGCVQSTDQKTISVAVTGSPSVYSRYYEQGVKMAYDALCKEYPDYNIVCEFYDDKDDYATAEQITSKLVSDETVTAILASSSSEICANQAYRTNQSNKLLVCPHWIYDDTLTENSYSNVFAINYSSEQIGEAMSFVAKYTDVQRWALCYSDDEICNSEIRGFGNEANIADSVKMSVLESEFNKTVERWRLLGIDGVVFVPYDSDFELLYKLKEAMPSLTVISDSSLDDANEVEANRRYFNKVYIVDSFFTDDGDSDVFELGSGEVDTWEIHGYNALRMIVDTAVKNNTTDPAEIARLLHTDGYDGELESYRFNANGSLVSEYFSYTEFTNDDAICYAFKLNKE